MADFIGLTLVILISMLALQLLANKFNIDISGVEGAAKLNHRNDIEARLESKDKEIKALAKRVAVLERLVTDPREQLKREIDRL